MFLDWLRHLHKTSFNATLIGRLEDGEEAIVVELTEPNYDPEAGTVSYQFRVLEQDEITDRVFDQEPITQLDASRTYVEPQLSIDASSWCFNCTIPGQTYRCMLCPL